MAAKRAIPVVGVVGWSGSGKTVLLEKLITELAARGYRIGTVKHSMHRGIEPDSPGSDTWRHARAGSVISVLTAPGLLALFERREDDPSLEDALSRISGVDLILVEGYKSAEIPKIELIGTGQAESENSPRGDLIAVMSAALIPKTSTTLGVPVLQRDNIKALADLIETKYL